MRRTMVLLLACAACATIDYPSGEIEVPVTVLGISWGSTHACAATSDGTIVCWGNNASGQLAIPGSAMALTPTIAELGPLPLRGATAGYTGTCARDTDSATWCWGGGSELPRLAAEGRELTGVRGGAFFCGRALDATLWCWDTLSNGTHPIPGSTSFLAYDVGGKGCAIGSDSLATCWGNDWTPVPVPGGITFRTISVGAGHSCGIGGDGKARCWGNNSDGQLGTNNLNSTDTPTLVIAPISGDTLVSVNAGFRHSCGLGKVGRPYCWGWAGGGAIGIGHFAGIENVNYKAPISVILAPAIVGSIEPRDGSTCGAAAGGAIWCWGTNDLGQLGTGTTETAWTPVQVPVTLEPMP